jgi:hypothetical protein
MTDLDEQLREHYAAFRSDHGSLRERLLDELRSEPARTAETSTSRFFNRRLLMRLSAAAVAAIAVGVIASLLMPGATGTTWADVVRAIGAIETVQYVTTMPAGGGDLAGAPVTRTKTCLTAKGFMRTDTWSLGGESAQADQVHIVRNEGREVTNYQVSWTGGRVSSVTQMIDYVSAEVPKAGPADATKDAIAMWRGLQSLAPEAVLKRGSVEDDKGQRLLRFELIDANVPGIATFAAEASAEGPGGEGLFGRSRPNTFILVDPATKRPVMLEIGTARWKDIRFNETIPDEQFAPPAVPDDLDADVAWRFTLPADRWLKDGFVFRVLDAEGTPIVTTDDVVINQMARVGFGGRRGAEAPADAVVSSKGWLSAEGVGKLDRFMARNPGAEMTIEMTGEPPVKRKVYGRLARQPHSVFGDHSVHFVLPSLADVKASTQPVKTAAPGTGFVPGGFDPEGLAPH